MCSSEKLIFAWLYRHTFLLKYQLCCMLFYKCSRNWIHLKATNYKTRSPLWRKERLSRFLGFPELFCVLFECSNSSKGLMIYKKMYIHRCFVCKKINSSEYKTLKCWNILMKHILLLTWLYSLLWGRSCRFYNVHVAKLLILQMLFSFHLISI